LVFDYPAVVLLYLFLYHIFCWILLLHVSFFLYFDYPAVVLLYLLLDENNIFYYFIHIPLLHAKFFFYYPANTAH